MFEISFPNFKTALAWLTLSFLFAVISAQSASLFVFAEPHNPYILTSMNSIFHTLSALAIMQSFKISWWLRPIVLVIAYCGLTIILPYGSDWAMSLRWPNGRPPGAYHEFGSEQALAGLFALVESFLLAVGWLAVSIWRTWRSRRAESVDSMANH